MAAILPGCAVLEQDLAQEISFFEYRLGILCGWPDSERRSVLIEATAARLRSLREMSAAG